MGTTLDAAPRRLLTVDQILEITHVSESTIWREIRAGKLRVVRLRGRTLIDERDLWVWVDRSKDPETT